MGFDQYHEPPHDLSEQARVLTACSSTHEGDDAGELRGAVPA